MSDEGTRQAAFPTCYVYPRGGHALPLRNTGAGYLYYADRDTGFGPRGKWLKPQATTQLTEVTLIIGVGAVVEESVE